LVSSGYDSKCHVIAIGKVADSMMQGALDVLQDNLLSGLLISKKENFSADILNESRLKCVAGDHPIPADNSLQAGRQLLDYLDQLPNDEPCLFLISGGTSSLVEVLVEGVTLADLQSVNNTLLASGKDIHEINAVRKRMSRIKGGGLWDYLSDREVHCLMISDVRGDNPKIIGSGLLFSDSKENYPTSFSWEVVANLDHAKAAAKRKAECLGYSAEAVEHFMQGSAE